MGCPAGCLPVLGPGHDLVQQLPEAAAEAGLGVARLPDFVAADAIASGALARVLPDWSCTPSEVFLVHRFGHERIKRVGTLVAAALEQVGGLLDATRECR